MGNVTDLFGRPFTASEPIIAPPESQLRDAIEEAGLIPPDHIRIDGQLHRFSSSGKARDDSGWYVAFPGSVVAGQFGDWRSGISVPWRADIGRDLTLAENMALSRQAAEAKRLRDAAQAQRRESAADTAEAIWSGATPASDDHPYLLAKGISAHGLRVTGDGRLVCPMYSPDGELVSLQFIGADGEKRFLSGGKVSGATFTIGSGSPIYVCEGVATAITIFEATGHTAMAAYSAGNLTAAAQFAATLGQVVVVADNDESGTGQREAARAAEAVGCRVVVPPTLGHDMNDHAKAGGDVAALLAPPDTSGYLIAADDFAGQPAPIRWVVKHWIQREALHMIHGPSGSGKTFVVLDMILSAAAGLGEWFGNRVTQVPVVYLAGEGHQGLRARIAGWKLANEVDHLQAWVSRAGDDLNTPGGLMRVQEAIRGLPVSPAIIVVDTLHRFLNGDENSAQDAKTMLDSCALLQAEFSAAVILVHHTGVSDESQHRARGSSAWRGALDIEISVIPATDDKPMEIVQRKAKDSELARPAFAQLATIVLPWTDEDGEQVKTAHLKQDDSVPEKAPTESRSEGASRQFIEGAMLSYWTVNPTNGMPFISRHDVNEHGKTLNASSESGRRATVSRHLKACLAAGIVRLTDGHDYEICDPLVAAVLKLAHTKKE